MENMNAEQNTQSENMGNETEVQEQAERKEEKMFTQDEVNSFIQARISRMKGQIAKEAKTEYEQKLSDLKARENILMIKEALQARNMPRELADVITCTDEADLNKKLDLISDVYDKKDKKKEEQKGFRIGASANSHAGVRVDPVRQAMGLNRKG